MTEFYRNGDRWDDTQEAYHQIMDAIVTQKLTPSQKVSENIFADMFGISRSISRNLIERLIAKQFLISVSPRVTQVAPLTLLEIKQNFMLRKILLPEAFSLAAPKVDFNALSRLAEEIENMLPIEDDETALKVLKTNKCLNLLAVEKTSYPLVIDWIEQLEDTAMRIYWLYTKINKSFFYSREQMEMTFSVMKNDEPGRTRKVLHDILTQTEDRILNSIFSQEQFNTQDLKV
ncbi:GntR family transcriptional regulator [Emcibacter nanhaiensis]|uniref:GntR family transcriptional regulator n=1 Tax=Emcibacter nanhaiensis TaxID=1505037 RepID=A0A501PDF7_9PROT|nr:GntR family transcriptional regulator [Emcibacter nanhaiensis]TPD57934.1 GntR family transcriptional regulator [Emcibacter nanhaiensis]